MEEQLVKNLCLELMESAETAIFTTIDQEGLPQTRGMLNLRNKEQYPGLVDLFSQHHQDCLVYFTTNTSSAKISQIKQNPHGTVYYCKPGEWRGLMLGGKIQLVTSPTIKQSLWQPGWEIYYPGGFSDADYSVLCLAPESAKYYHQLSVTMLKFPQG